MIPSAQIKLIIIIDPCSKPKQSRPSAVVCRLLFAVVQLCWPTFQHVVVLWESRSHTWLADVQHLSPQIPFTRIIETLLSSIPNVAMWSLALLLKVSALHLFRETGCQVFYTIFAGDCHGLFQSFVILPLRASICSFPRILQVWLIRLTKLTPWRTVIEKLISRSTSQKIPRLVCNPAVLHRVHKSPRCSRWLLRFVFGSCRDSLSRLFWRLSWF